MNRATAVDQGTTFFVVGPPCERKENKNTGQETHTHVKQKTGIEPTPPYNAPISLCVKGISVFSTASPTILSVKTIWTKDLVNFF